MIQHETWRIRKGNESPRREDLQSHKRHFLTWKYEAELVTRESIDLSIMKTTLTLLTASVSK